MTDIIPWHTIETDDLTEDLLDEYVPPIPDESGFASCVIVDNLPTVPEEKYGKLLGILQKIFANVGTIAKDGIYMPKDPKTKMSLGFAFIEFLESRSAAAAVQKLNGGKLDKSHIFAVNFYDDLKRFREFPEEYVAPQPKEFEDKNNLYSWLLDDKHSTGDQFVIRFDVESEIYWNEADKKPELSYKKKNWTDSYVAWSPKGTYLCTFHGKGVMLWGGETWNTLGKLEHIGVKLIDFSPQERFLVTFNPENGRDENAMIIWNIKTGEKIRGFPGGEGWPIFKWSHDDKYVARLGKGAIHIWEMPSMTLLNGKPLKIANVKDFQWSPSQHTICCWVPEDTTTSTPARLMLIDVLTGRERRTKNLFNVTDCKMHWQNKGDFLCVKVDRHQKKKKSTYFELFRLREKGVPIEVLELSNQNIIAFAWEPEGNRFGIIHTSESSNKPDVSFYAMEGTQFKHLKTLEKRSANHLFWSPRGNHIVLAGLRNFNGALEFFDVNEMETMASGDHFMATELEWDPTGRFVGSASSAWRHQLENGYCIWSFQGRLLQKVLKEKFYQFLWRPRPPSLLSEEKEKEIKKNLSQIEKVYTEQDKKERKRQEQERKRVRDVLRRSFLDFLEERRKQLRDEKEERRKLRGYGSDEERDIEWVERDIEEVVETHEELIE